MRIGRLPVRGFEVSCTPFAREEKYGRRFVGKCQEKVMGLSVQAPPGQKPAGWTPGVQQGNADMGYFLTVIGLLCFIEGLPYFAFPEQLKKWFKQVILMPGQQLRIIGGCLLVLGLLLVYLGQRGGG
jgi:uncharacterized protein YjeT (DUF2065 family)